MPCQITQAEAEFYEREHNKETLGVDWTDARLTKSVACALARHIETGCKEPLPGWVLGWIERHKAEDAELAARPPEYMLQVRRWGIEYKPVKRKSLYGIRAQLERRAADKYLRPLGFTVYQRPRGTRDEWVEIIKGEFLDNGQLRVTKGELPGVQEDQEAGA